MKKLPLILSIIALVGVIALSCVVLSKGCCKKAKTVTEDGIETGAPAGSIVYFDLDRVLEEYDMANDLRSVVETKVNSINQEVNRRGGKLEKDIKAFQDKMNKGLLTQSVAEAQGQKLQEQQNNFQQYAGQKQQEIAEEQQVMMNQIADAIKTYIDAYNAEKQYAMIITTQGGILPAPVVCGDPMLDITDDILAGLNAEYVKEKGKTNEE
ncbi:MAG: OmpH family outer membrane protein [Bacteroidales bacterium]|nr:OmpH family outer membrane protein [Bacteroidales bacterium]